MLKRPKRVDLGLSRRSSLEVLAIFGPALLITAVGFIVALQFVKPAPPRHILMATGTDDGAYHRFGLRYKEVLARYGIELELLQTAGAHENLRLLNDPSSGVEVAFLQGGLGAKREHPGLETLGSVFFEPLWIFSTGAAPETVHEMRGWRVAVGTPDSGTYHAFDFLAGLNGLSLEELDAMSIGGEAAEAALRAGEVDAACFMASLEAPYIRRLLETDDMVLMPVVRGEAYQRRFRFLATVVLPRGVADFERDLPPRDVPLLAVVANIGVRETLHPALVGPILEAATEVHHEGDLFARPGQFPSESNVVLPMNPDARRYVEKGPPFLQRYLPFWLAIAIDRLAVLLIPLATLLYPLFKIVPPAYRWRVRRRITRYYRALLGVEARLDENPSPAEIDRSRRHLDDIEKRLSDVVVPQGYADMLYRLRLHLQFVRERLDAVHSRAAAQRRPDGPDAVERGGGPVSTQDRA